MHNLSSYKLPDSKACSIGACHLDIWLLHAGHAQQDTSHSGSAANLDVRWTRLPGLLRDGSDGERIFRALYGGQGGLHTFWLDR